MKEAIHGKTRHTFVPERRRPVEEYLQTQRRYQHLFVPHRREEAIAAIPRDVDAYWAAI